MAKAGDGQSGTKSYRHYRCTKQGCGYSCLDYNDEIIHDEKSIDIS
jgi:hypothetical protein